MKYLLLFLFIASSAVAASTQVTVEVAVNGQPDDLVRQFARVKAQREGIVRLPVLITGVERLVNGQFSEEVKAASVAHVIVNPVNEQWDRANNKYTLTAEVELDSEKTLAVMALVKGSANAKDNLKKAYAVIDRLSQLDGTTASDYLKAKEAINSITSHTVVRSTIESSLKARQKYVEEAFELYEAMYVLPVLRNNTVLNITEVDESKVYYTYTITQNFNKEGLNTYWSKNDVLKRAWKKQRIGLCLTGKAGTTYVTSELANTWNRDIVNKGYLYHNGNDDTVANFQDYVKWVVCDKIMKG
ncbi:hypothetical protein [Alteromonas gilva]|uniref:Uncharacterized protein n=1 Tax=Alteromonas gilva TaxID=2987522 RepID=A0ABT5L7K9_9ALTE|nr:hypothetical protein [Alteromonas gilva]MDC8832862.1 hypothetical protein [Alteromonas gilva]